MYSTSVAFTVLTNFPLIDLMVHDWASDLSFSDLKRHIVPFPLGTFSFNELLSVTHINRAPSYRHKAGSMCFLSVVLVTLASPHDEIIRCLKKFVIGVSSPRLLLDWISASMITVCSGGSLFVLVTDHMYVVMRIGFGKLE
jgi:hypothetical protein